MTRVPVMASKGRPDAAVRAYQARYGVPVLGGCWIGRLAGSCSLGWAPRDFPLSRGSREGVDTMLTTRHAVDFAYTAAELDALFR